MTKPRSQPPDLNGYTYKSFLGGGGFADVFLYKEHRPVRDVAVKVLRTEGVDDAVRQAFESEANLMAKVSGHQYIVTVHRVDTAPDGRPYLVMEYYARSNYGARALNGGLPVDEVLRVGIQIGAAVEFAHREGVVHRDIKPSNILVHARNHPGLTDFGIAGARAGDGEQAAPGWSPPFAPPEIVKRQSAGGVVSDVYSLAASLHTMLAGWTPFTPPGQRNTSAEIVERVINQPVPAITRPDMPPALQHLLAQAMSKAPGSRPQSALNFARSLQSIQRELQLAPTPIDVQEEATAPPEALRDDVEGTRRERPRIVLPVIPEVHPEPARDDVVPEPALASDRFGDPVLDLRPVADTMHRPDPEPAPRPVEPPAPGPRRSLPRSLTAAAAALVVAAVVATLIVAMGGRGTSPPASQPTDDGDVTLLDDRPAAPTAVTVQLQGATAEVVWKSPDRKPGDRYIISSAAVQDAPPLATVDSPPARVQGLQGRCVRVVAVRGIDLSQPAEACLS